MQLRRCLIPFAFAAIITSGPVRAGAEALQVAFPPTRPVAAEIGEPELRGLRITVDFVAMLHVEGGMRVIAVGNPAIADANLVNHQTLIVTGHMAGTTNVIALDEAGRVLVDVLVRVSAQKPGMVNVRRGTQVEVHSCITGLCEIGPNEATSTVAPAVVGVGG